MRYLPDWRELTAQQVVAHSQDISLGSAYQLDFKLTVRNAGGRTDVRLLPRRISIPATKTAGRKAGVS